VGRGLLPFNGALNVGVSFYLAFRWRCARTTWRAWTARASTARAHAGAMPAELLCPYARQRLIRWNQARRMARMQTAERLHPFRAHKALGVQPTPPARHQAGHARAEGQA
jgi:hypothetical protein